ncbi:MAG: pyruvate kinase alpha/beta domain-containing protein [Thermodesulfobacteriota bacterium]|nr:pyruvate kinase alpha/beta domain-containing protein [Thermodesulfobacteriota bacterium]
MYLENAGKQNTDLTLKEVFYQAKKRGISDLVVASTGGETGLKAAAYLESFKLNLVVVTHNTGFKEKGKQEFPEEFREKIERSGGRIYTGTMVLRGLGAAIRSKAGGYSHEQLIADTLRIFGQGTKVCVEIAAMASDAGLIPQGMVIAVAGTGRGADTAILLQADSSNHFFDIKILEYLVKPKSF